MKISSPGDIARTALVTFGVIAAGVTVIAVIESYSNLLAFALAYGLSGWRAAIAPGAIDSFIILGELLLFASILLKWGAPPHILGACMAAWGFLLSVSGNIWHAHSATAADRAVSAVWPVTATAALAGALLIVRQVTMTSGALVPHPPTGQAAGTELPPPAPRREEEPHPLAVTGGEPGAERPQARRKRGAAEKAEEQALLAELLAQGGPLPSRRALSLEKTGSGQSSWVSRVYAEAERQLNGASHGD